MTKSIAIAGATGFAGVELYRILYNHPAVEVTALTSESRAGMKYNEVYPQLRNFTDLKLKSAEDVDPSDIDLIFLALPHGTSMDYVKIWVGNETPIIDLSGDFRLLDTTTYEEWYEIEHTFSEGFEKSIYGLTEWHRDEIREADLIANPGCYPTSVLFSILPLLLEEVIKAETLIADSKSGVTGAGAGLKETTKFATTHDNFNAYGFPRHRHAVEIEQSAKRLNGIDFNIQFTPHLIPANRGILSTIYAEAQQPLSTENLRELYRHYYKDEFFIRLADTPVEINQVRATNFCDVYPVYDERTNRIIVVSVIDNLVKGASGQAIQNMNVRMGWEENMGLNSIPVVP